jgi:hypothetical protein
MHRLRAAAERGGDDRLDAQVALSGGRRTDAHRPIGAPGSDTVAVGRGDRKHAFDAETAAGAKDADRDLAAVGHQDAADRPPRRAAHERFAPLRAAAGA